MKLGSFREKLGGGQMSETMQQEKRGDLVTTLEIHAGIGQLPKQMLKQIQFSYFAEQIYGDSTVHLGKKFCRHCQNELENY